ncbi:MAG: hypothetical protein QOE33_220 [Acidobacteriota bacterium]|nr:hypothetical protein [Acidobacteriota bacterium]
MRLLRVMVLVVIALILGIYPANAQQCEARVSANGEGPKGRLVETTLNFHRLTNGETFITFYVLNPDEIEGFTFPDFEGPHAPAASRRLTTIKIRSAGREAAISARVAGWYDRPNSFVFSLATSQLSGTERHLIRRLLTSELQSVSITVRDSRNRDRAIRASYSLDNYKESIRRVFLGCGGTSRHNNGMQRTRASAFLSCTLNRRSPLMPGVRLLDSRPISIINKDETLCASAHRCLPFLCDMLTIELKVWHTARIPDSLTRCYRCRR